MTGNADFVPKRRLISNVTNAFEAVVTTTEDHGYQLRQYIRLIVPSIYGMELFYIVSQIQSLTSNTFTTDIDTTQLEPFVTPMGIVNFTEAQCVPINGLTDNVAI